MIAFPDNHCKGLVIFFPVQVFEFKSCCVNLLSLIKTIRPHYNQGNMLRTSEYILYCACVCGFLNSEMIYLLC